MRLWRMRLWIGWLLFFLLPVAGQPCIASAEPAGSPSPSPKDFPGILTERELTPYRGKGRASITGQAFLVTRLNKVLVQPGGVVMLLPVTRQTREWFEQTVQATSCDESNRTAICGRQAIFAVMIDKRVAPYLRVTRSNPTGHFWFAKVPAGRYYVLSPIAGGPDREPKTNGIASAQVEVEWGERLTNVVVTGQTRDQ
jgi:hypothetical protein